MNIKRNITDVVFDIFNILIMLVLSIIFIYPFLHVLFASISEPVRFLRHQGLIFYPLGIDFTVYKLVLGDPMVIGGYLNTLFVVGAGTSVSLLLTILGAYVLSKRKLKFRRILSFFVVFSMFFSGGLIPFYLISISVGMRNTLWALIFPSAISTFNMLVLRTAFAQIPDSLIESAEMDGAKDIRILFLIIVPLSMATIAIIILFYSVSRWNSWFHATIFINQRKLFPFAVILREVLISDNSEAMLTGAEGGTRQIYTEAVKYATIIVAVLPVLFVYPFLQKYFVKGMMIGSIKG